METQEAAQLCSKRCVPCEGGVPKYTLAEAEAQLARLQGWALDADKQTIRKQWKFKNFVQALAFVNRVGELAEQEQHHPDLHLTGYRFVGIEIMTHAIGGLSENDFILAAKIDQLTPPSA